MTCKTILTYTAGAAAALALAACVTPTPYQPSPGGVNQYGFSDTRIEPGKYRVSFRGNSSTERTTVENYLLLRAAELTLADGLGHFTVLDEDEGSLSSFSTTGFNSGFGGRFGFGFGNRGFGGTNTSRTRERRNFDVGVVIQAFPGQKSAENYEAFNAQDVVDNIGPLAQR